jgi:hypothetical protein
MLYKRFLILALAGLFAFGPEIVNVDGQQRKRAKYTKSVKKRVKKKKRKKTKSLFRKSKTSARKKFSFPL